MNRNTLPHRRRFFLPEASFLPAAVPPHPAANRSACRVSPAEVFNPASPPTLTDIQQNCRIAAL